MRLVVKKYANGQTYTVETTNDGTGLSRELEGTREVGERISAYLEATCDDTVEGADRLLAALTRLKEVVEQWKQELKAATTALNMQQEIVKQQMQAHAKKRKEPAERARPRDKAAIELAEVQPGARSAKK